MCNDHNPTERTIDAEALDIVQGVLHDHMVEADEDMVRITQVGSIQDKTLPFVFLDEDGNQHVAFIQVRYGQPI